MILLGGVVFGWSSLGGLIFLLGCVGATVGAEVLCLPLMGGACGGLIFGDTEMFSFDVVDFRDVELSDWILTLGGSILPSVDLGLAGIRRELTRSRCTACSTEGQAGLVGSLLPVDLLLCRGDAFLICCCFDEKTFKLLLVIFALVKELLAAVESLASDVTDNELVDFVGSFF